MLHNDPAYKPGKSVLELFTDTVWFCRSVIDPKETKGCKDPCFAIRRKETSKLPDNIPEEKLAFLSVIQLIIFKDCGCDIEMLRASGSRATHSLGFEEVISESTPVNKSKTTNDNVAKIVGPECVLYSTIHSAAMYRQFSSVCVCHSSLITRT